MEAVHSLGKAGGKCSCFQIEKKFRIPTFATGHYSLVIQSSIATHFSPQGMNGPRTSEKLRAEKPRHCRNSNLRFLYCYKQRGMLEEKRTKVINHYVELNIFIEDLKYVIDFFYIYIFL